MDEARELEIRKALSKMLNAPFKPQKQYDYGDRERVVYSWDEIFFELGKLTEKASEETYPKYEITSTGLSSKI